MIDQFKNILKELMSDKSEFAKQQADTLKEYIDQYTNGDLTDKQFLKYVSILGKIDAIHEAAVEIETRATIQKVANLAKELLAKLV